MSKTVVNIKPYPDYEKEVISFDKKGEKITKKVKVTDNFLVTTNNGNSIVVQKDDLQELGIYGSNIKRELVEDNEDDDELIVTSEENTNPSETVVTENSPLVLK